MARPNTLKGTKVSILIGDTQDPPVYTKFCGLTAKAIRFVKNTNEFFVPDCDDPDDPAWRELAASGRSATITGSGILDLDAQTAMRAAMNDSDPVPMKVMLDDAAGGAWTGTFMVTEMNVTGNDGELTQVSLTLESSGEVLWTAA